MFYPFFKCAAQAYMLACLQKVLRKLRISPGGQRPDLKFNLYCKPDHKISRLYAKKAIFSKKALSGRATGGQA